MKKLITALALVLAFAWAPQIASADVWVDGYYRSDGTWVRGHYRSEPDGYFWNNYSSYGNINPYTGEHGYKWPDYSSSSSSYDNYRSYYYDYYDYSSYYYDSYDYDWNYDSYDWDDKYWSDDWWNDPAIIYDPERFDYE